MPDIQPILRADPTERVSLSKSPTHPMPNESPRNFQDLQRQDPPPRMSPAYHPPPGVLKDLEEYIAKIPSSVSSVRAAFEIVDGRLESVASSQLADCKSIEELKGQWRVIKESYSTVLHKSSEIAIQSATAVNDFITRVIPFVENEDITISLETKQAELTQYQKIVDEDKGHAAQFSRSFTDIRSDVQAFKLKCAAHKKHIKDSLVGAIRKLEGEIKKLDSAVRKVKAIFAVFRNSISNSKEREKLRDAVNNASKRAKIEKCAGLQEAKSKLRQIDYDTDVIHDKSEGVEKEMSLLVTVWRMIGNDAEYVRTQLRFCLGSTCFQMFNPRFSDLEVKYRTLYDHLNKYASALSQADSLQDETGYETTGRGVGFQITLTAHVYRTE